MKASVIISTVRKKRFGKLAVYLWGSPLEITKQDKIKDLRDWLTNDLLISAFEISVNKVPVPDCYGSREGGFVCHECREGRYHVIEPNYIIEFLREGSAAGTGEDGEVVLTHLDAWGMPLIRYRTGDVAQPGEDSPCACGRTWRTIRNIKGRTTDFVVTPDGRWQHALSVIYVVRDIEGVDEFKIIQHTVDEIEVLIKTHPDLFPDNGEDRIVKGFKKRMGDTVHVAVKFVDEIPRDASGKYRYVVSHVGAFGGK